MTTEIMNYTPELQKFFLSFLASNDEVYAQCQTVLNPTYFDQTLQTTVEYIKAYADENHAVPSVDHINAVSGVGLTVVPEAVEERHVNGFITEFEKFCKHRAMEGAVHGAIDLLDKGLYSDVKENVEEALNISIHKELGLDYFLDPRTRIERMMNEERPIPTGWEIIDEKLYGGVARGALNIFAGGSGMGKSLFLQNIARNWYKMGLNVLYISLELQEDLIAKRMDAMEVGIGTRDIFKKIDEVELKLSMSRKECGAYQIKQLPQGCTVNDLRAYIKQYTIQTGIKIDALVVDYLDLMHPNAKGINLGDAFTKDKLVSEELRGFAMEQNMYLFTASQLNRTAVVAATEGGGNPTYDHSHIAGGLSKINTADNVMTVFKSKKDEEDGIYRIQFIKTRSSNGVGQKVFLGFDDITLRIYNIDQSDIVDDTPDDSQILSDYTDALEKQKALRANITERNKTKTDDLASSESSKEDAVRQKAAIMKKFGGLVN